MRRPVLEKLNLVASQHLQIVSGPARVRVSPLLIAGVMVKHKNNAEIHSPDLILVGVIGHMIP